jgi:hypothetical protein
VKEGECIVIAVLPVLSQPSTAVEPADRPLDDPALGFDDKAFGAISAFDDLNHQTAHRCGGAVVEDRACIGAISEQLAQERELSEQSGHQDNAAVAILNIGRGHQRVQHQTQRIDQEVTLLPLDQLAGIKAVWVDGGAPFSALFTLWLSITQAVGLASRSACSRHLM